ncbi:hypothetical protein FRAHR75_20143 [Frankia sp. Hr75.2]|nr:hypothetical protein FRAHR75_20143 [Frankia sp. Hr75.2]SQD93412.1 hypothetical protein FMEAI12_1650011 [Parafrankia sp. Ea1.12]
MMVLAWALVAATVLVCESPWSVSRFYPRSTA